MSSRYTLRRRRRARLRDKSWYTPIRRSRHNSSPRYALTIIGCLISRRLKDNSLVSKGVSLVKQISSVSLGNWTHRKTKSRKSLCHTPISICSVECTATGKYVVSSRRELKKLKRVTKGMCSKSSSSTSESASSTIQNIEMVEQVSFTSSSSDDMNNTGQSRLTHNSRSESRVKRTKSKAKMSAVRFKNRNKNARVINESSTDSSSCAVSKPTRQQVSKIIKRRKPMRCSRLVARSIGRPKIAKHPRSLTKKFGLVDKRKRLKRLRAAKKLRAQYNSSQSEDANSYESDSAIFVNMKRFCANKKRVDPHRARCEIRKHQAHQVDSKKLAAEKLSKPSTSTKEQRNQSPNSENSFGTSNRKHNQHHIRSNNHPNSSSKRAKSGKRKEQYKTQHSKDQSTAKSGGNLRIFKPNEGCDNVNWPSLPSTSRMKGMAKETATAIVTTKLSGSVNKMSKKRWADIVAQISPIAGNSLEDSEIGKMPTREVTEKSYESIATNRELDTANAYAICSKDLAQASGEISELKSLSLKKKKRRKNRSKRKMSSLLLTESQIGNKVPLTLCKQFPSGNACVLQKKRAWRFKKVEPENPIKLGTMAKSHPSSFSGVEESSKKAAKIKTIKAENMGKRSKLPAETWKMDDLIVVYSKQVGPVISLKDPSQFTSKSSKNVNTCNNFKMVTRLSSSINKEDEKMKSPTSKSNTDACDSSSRLCSRLSLISFQTKRKRKDGIASRRQAESKPKPSSETVKDGDCNVTRQRKVSQRYRALIRRDFNHADLKTVSGVQTRSKRTEILQEDRAAKRTAQRFQRQQKQSTVHQTHRLPFPPSVDDKAKKKEGMFEKSQGWCIDYQFDNNQPGPSKAKDMSSFSQQKCNSRIATEEATKNSGENNSQGTEKMVSFVKPFSKKPSSKETEIPVPVSAKSAPELAKRQNICVELNADQMDNLDIGWWSAYLNHNTEGGSSTTQTGPKTSSSTKT